MFNLFRSLHGIFLFFEVVVVVALLKPVREPCIVRDSWIVIINFCKGEYRLFLYVILVLSTNVFLDLCFEDAFYKSFLENVADTDVVLIYRESKDLLSYFCFYMAIFLLIIIERIARLLITVARLLEFELMCRYSILTGEPQQSSFNKNTMVMLASIDSYTGVKAKRRITI